MLPIIMCVAGNSFLFVSDREECAADAIYFCAKYNTDGLVYIKECCGKFGYSLYNADGSKAKFCGNATMCLAKLLFDNCLVTKKRFEIYTDSGCKTVEICGAKNQKVALEVGKPHFFKIYPCDCGSVLLRFNKCGKVIRIRVFPVDTGNRHLVIFCSRNLSDEEVLCMIKESGLFPCGVNVEFAKVYDDYIAVRVYERGCGKTLACGSGAAAVAFAANSINMFRREIRFEGGKIFAAINCGKVTVIGEPKYIKSSCNCERFFKRKGDEKC